MSAPPLLVFGGTFDPPHLGHLVLAECARAQFGGAQVLFMPAGHPYRKVQRPVSEPAARLAMTRLAIQDNPAFVVDDREIRRAGPSYTVDTLDELHAEGHTNLVVILGTDAIADMPHWKTPERIPELATIAIAPKDDVEKGGPLGVPNARLIDMPWLPVSSTLIRARIASGKPIRYLVPAAVEDYIRTHRIYD